MSMRLDYVWPDDETILFQASCDSCSFRSTPFEDEQMATASWFGHVCVRPGRMAIPQTPAAVGVSSAG